MTYIDYIEDNNGDLVDLKYYCSFVCAPEEVSIKGASPVIESTDYDIHCETCEDLIQHAIKERLIIKSDGMGIAKLSGTDNHGMVWAQFEVDYLAEETDGTCSACQDQSSEGWLCLDDSEELCDECVDFQEPPIRYYSFCNIK